MDYPGHLFIEDKCAVDPNKRVFLKGLAASGLALIGGARFLDTAFAATASYEVDPGTLFDVIIMGAGTAGIPLAVFACQRGAKVLVIEKSPQIGGTLWVSGGQISAAGTKLQARKGIADTPEKFMADLRRLTHGRADPKLLKRYVEQAGPTADWLESVGLQLPAEDPVKGKGHANFETERYLSPVGAGRGLRGVMAPAFLEAETSGRLRVLMNTSVRELIQDKDGTVRGVVAQDKNGRSTRFNAVSTVLAAGGAMMNPELFKRYTGRTLYGLRAFPTSTGDGLVLGVAAGGNVSGGDKFLAHRGVIVTDRNYPAKTFTTIGLQLNPQNRQPWEIEVNAQGKRYVAEDSDIDVLERAQTDQTGMASWLIWDQAIADNAPPLFARLNKDALDKAFSDHPMFFKADSIAALATKMKLPVEAVVKTVETYNRAVTAKHDRLGRKHLPLPVGTGPFYAVECLGCAIFSQFGLDIDDDMRVLSKQKRPIPGLYAVGEVTGGWHTNGDAVVNGGGVTPAVALGRYLGMTLPIAATAS